jgi:hypothetical protein
MRPLRSFSSFDIVAVPSIGNCLGFVDFSSIGQNAMRRVDVLAKIRPINANLFDKSGLLQKKPYPLDFKKLKPIISTMSSSYLNSVYVALCRTLEARSMRQGGICKFTAA